MEKIICRHSRLIRPDKALPGNFLKYYFLAPPSSIQRPGNTGSRPGNNRLCHALQAASLLFPDNPLDRKHGYMLN